MFAAEISPDECFAGITALLDRYAVLVLRNHPLDDEQQIRFSEQFGPLETAVGALRTGRRRIQDQRIADVSNLDADGRIRDPADPWRLMQKANEFWHTDSSFKPVPGKISLLSAREIPATGGAATEFVDLRAAYDALDPATRKRIEPLSAEHSVFYSRRQVGYTDFSNRERTEFPPVARPIVRLHAGSNRKTLYLASHASHVVGLPLQEGRELLDALIDHATQPHLVYSHRWQQDDLLIWDNRCTMHRARPYDDIEMRRDMRRTTVADINP